MTNEKVLPGGSAAEEFLESPNHESFARVFHVFTPQVISFFRARGCNPSLSEDLAQEVMLAVYRKAHQLRDRSLFRAWLFRVARNVLSRHYGKEARGVETIALDKVVDSLTASTHTPAGTHAFEFLGWMEFLNGCEQEALRLRFIEEWEYHEIASAKAIPIGTVQWRVFNAKKKLAPLLKARGDQHTRERKAA